jgi:tetratricopeptide (TPR) repeat protein
LALLERADPADPFAPLLALRRAGLLDRLDKLPEAEAELRRLSAQFRAPFSPWRGLAIYRGRQNWPPAIAAYDAAIARIGVPAVAHSPIFYARGIALERAKRWPEAEADFQRALSLSPEQPLVLNYLAYSWVELGRSWSKRGACWNARWSCARMMAISPIASVGRCISLAISGRGALAGKSGRA